MYRADLANLDGVARVKQKFECGEMWLGDCLELMADIPDGSVDMILCDLPYGTTQNKWDAVIPFAALWAHYWRVAKPNAAVVLTAQCPFDKALGASQLQYLKYEWVWRKTKATGHLNSRLQPLKNHENILVFYKIQPTYEPQGLIRKETPTIRRGGDNGGNYGKSDKMSLTEYENYPRAVLEIGSEGRTVHPTQKPVALFDYLIRTYTQPGELVLDNCSGSGTTAVAAHQSDRRYLCIERDMDYYFRSLDRVAAL